MDFENNDFWITHLLIRPVFDVTRIVEFGVSISGRLISGIWGEVGNLTHLFYRIIVRGDRGGLVPSPVRMWGLGLGIKNRKMYDWKLSLNV